MSVSNLNFVGWDIGGAHLKMAGLNAQGKVLRIEQLATPLWQGLHHLESALSDIKSRIDTPKVIHTVTTTGELSDLFQNRAQGVDVLLSEFSKAFKGDQVNVYAGSAGIIPRNEANRQYRQIASANWHASASYVASQQSEGVLVDIGSSTTDIIPFKGGRLCNQGYSDQERMRHDELLYTGIVRTPLMAIVNNVPYAGKWQSVAAEQFATMADVYRITGELDESHDLMPTADGADKTIRDSVRRVARMLGTDVEENESCEEYHKLAQFIAEEQLHKITQALHRVISAHEFSSHFSLVGAGAGRFLIAKLARRLALDYVDIELMLPVEEGLQSEAADCVTAVSVAQLGRLAV